MNPTKKEAYEFFGIEIEIHDIDAVVLPTRLFKPLVTRNPNIEKRIFESRYIVYIHSYHNIIPFHAIRQRDFYLDDSSAPIKTDRPIWYFGYVRRVIDDDSKTKIQQDIAEDLEYFSDPRQMEASRTRIEMKQQYDSLENTVFSYTIQTNSLDFLKDILAMSELQLTDKIVNQAPIKIFYNESAPFLESTGELMQSRKRYKFFNPKQYLLVPKTKSLHGREAFLQKIDEVQKFSSELSDEYYKIRRVAVTFPSLYILQNAKIIPLNGNYFLNLNRSCYQLNANSKNYVYFKRYAKKFLPHLLIFVGHAEFMFAKILCEMLANCNGNMLFSLLRHPGNIKSIIERMPSIYK